MTLPMKECSVEGFTIRAHEYRFNAPDSLKYCYAYTFEDVIVVRSLALDTSHKGEQLYAIGEKLGGAQTRLTSIQVETPEEDWESICAQHRVVVEEAKKQEERMVHVNFPVPALRLSQQYQALLTFQVKQMRQLTLWLNTEALIQYGNWTYEVMDKLFQSISYDAADEYQLQARINDFQKEATSVLLREKMKRAAEILAEQRFMDAGGRVRSQLVELEKELIVIRNELRDNLLTEYRVLKEMLEALEPVIDQHSELLDYHVLIKLFHALLGDAAAAPDGQTHTWGQRLMLVQMMHTRLGIIPAINSTNDLQKVNIGSAILLATSIMEKLYPPTQVLDLARNWETISIGLNKMIQAKGLAGYRAWLEQPITSDDEAKLKARTSLLVKFREIVFSLIQKIGVPLPKEFSQESRSGEVNHLLLNYFPAFALFRNLAGEKHLEKLITYDSVTGQVNGVTRFGQRVLFRL